MRHLLVVFTALFALSACSGFQTHTEVEALKEAKSIGSPFTQRLTSEYKAYVQAKQRSLDYADARHFARKGLLAAEGKVVMPEPLSNWHLDDKSAKLLRTARAELLAALNAGGRTQAPVEAAVAQAKYDCWIEQQEQNWATEMPASCRAAFETAMADLNGRVVKTVPKSEKIAQPIPVKTDPNAIPAEMDEGMFLAFFDFDRSTLNETGLQVIDEVAKQAKKRKDLRSIVVTGHTDTSGSATYNQKLSQRRADAVRNALIQRGVEADLIDATGRGETELMVSTANNTREPANRRAQITFE